MDTCGLESDSRRDQRQHRNRLRDDRRGPRLPGEAVPSEQRLARAEADSAAYGVEIVYTPGDEGTDGAIRRVREIYKADPDKYFYPDQYGNPANPAAHYTGTAPEIWLQTEGRITHFVAGLGTSGTFVGTTRRLKELNPRIRCISMQPDSGFHGLEGLKHMATDIVPSIYDARLADEDVAVQTEDGQLMARRLAREEGILAGVSAGAALWACLDVARRLPAGRARRDRHRVPGFGRKISERADSGAKSERPGAENSEANCCGEFTRTEWRPIRTNAAERFSAAMAKPRAKCSICCRSPIAATIRRAIASR